MHSKSTTRSSVVQLKDKYVQDLAEVLASINSKNIRIKLTPHNRIRIIALGYSGKQGEMGGIEESLNQGMEHIESVLSENGYEIEWPPFGLVNGTFRGTREIWIRFRKNYLVGSGPGYAR